VADRKGNVIPNKDMEVLIVIGCPKGKKVGRHQVLAVDRKDVVVKTDKTECWCLNCIKRYYEKS
jgi:hypothetical protein